MYWNNPLISAKLNSNRDPIIESFHNNQHCLFWNPAAKFDNITTNQHLIDLINWANTWLDTDGIELFTADARNHYDIANLVKLNMWSRDIRAQGIVKPWMILDCGDGTYLAGTGDSRLRCLEVLPEITHVPAFISTSTNRAHLYTDLEPVTNFPQFAQLCKADLSNEFLFRLTDPTAPYGIYWYEYNSSKTRAVTPSEQTAVSMFKNYITRNPSAKIDTGHFLMPINWQDFVEVV